MTMFNDTCIVINHYIDNNDADQYQETTLTGIYWERSRGIQTEPGGYSNDSSILVVNPYSISVSSQYVQPNEFEALPDKSGYWTLQEGDKIICNGKEMTITSISDYPHGSMAHWEVGGV